MQITITKKIKESNVITIIAPSTSGKQFKKTSLLNSTQNIKEILDLDILYSKNFLELNKLTRSSSIKSRINDLHQAFKNKNTSMIMCVSGGFNSNDLLPYIDWDILKNNPKPIIGYSDITGLANAIYAKTGLITYNGPSFITLGVKNQHMYTFEYFKKCFIEKATFAIFPSKYWGDRHGKKYKNIGFQIIQKGNARGIIVGGNLNTLNLLQGTEYMPDLKNKILLIEEDSYAAEFTPLEFERNLESLLQSTNRNHIKGILIGRFEKNSTMTFEKLKDIISRRNLSKLIPIISNIDFGHTLPMITFPIGGEISVKVGKEVVIQITKH